jgi:hypothetical protein
MSDLQPVKFIADEEFIAQLVSYASEDPTNLNMGAQTSEENPERQGFDVITISAIVGLISGTLYMGELAVKIFQWMQKSRGNKVIVQTATGSAEIHKTPELTPEAIHAQLLRAARHG